MAAILSRPQRVGDFWPPITKWYSHMNQKQYFGLIAIPPCDNIFNELMIHPPITFINV